MEYTHEQACFEYGRQQGKKEMREHILAVLRLLGIDPQTLETDCNIQHNMR